MNKLLSLLCLFAYLLICLFIPSPLFAKTPPPSLTIASPKEGETILGDSFTLSFVAGNLTYIDFAENKKSAANEGHLHLWLDTPEPSIKNTQEITTHDDIILKLSSPGNHSLILEVVKNDHSSYSPPIQKTVHFASLLPAPLPTPTPTPFINSFTPYITKEFIFTTFGTVLFIIGFIVYFFFGRKKFF